MICPMCLGKGYATDEDIKEYPHRCPNCDGKGFYSVDWQKVRCEVCNGSGKRQMTNEEWFCGLSTEEKAKTIVCLEVNALHKWKKRLVESDVDEIKRWLKEKHE